MPITWQHFMKERGWYIALASMPICILAMVLAVAVFQFLAWLVSYFARAVIIWVLGAYAVDGLLIVVGAILFTVSRVVSLVAAFH
jgi:hypothetical protein